MRILLIAKRFKLQYFSESSEVEELKALELKAAFGIQKVGISKRNEMEASVSFICRKASKIIICL